MSNSPSASLFQQPPKVSSPVEVDTHLQPPVSGDSYFIVPPPPPPQSTASKIRDMLRAPIAEFAGTAVFVLIGTGVDCQVVLSSDDGVAASQKGSFLSINFGWAIGLALGAWISGGISGGHLNPAVTLGMAIFRKFSWAKVPLYIFAQLLGGVIGATITYFNYVNAIDIFEGSRTARTQATASLFATFPLPYVNNITAFFTEFLGTAVLALMVLAASDKTNNAAPKGMFPIAIFLTLLGLGLSFGMQTSYAFNPARDFGPRLLLTMVGYGKQLYSFRRQYWLWCPIIAPFLGAIVGMGFYDLFLHKPEEEEMPKGVEMVRKNTEMTLAPQNSSQV